MREMVDVVVQRDAQFLARDAIAFKAEVQRWATKIGVQPKRVQIQCMTTKWASCSPAGRICFNVELLSENATFQQVVIVHELLHLLVPNHGKLFRSLMTAYAPGWEQVGGLRIVGLCR
jgi:predicted metal-dependent hydrolase